MDNEQAREEVEKWSRDMVESLERVVQRDEGRFQLLYSAFGAVAFAVLFFMLNTYVT